MNIDTLFTPSGFQTALKAYHKHLNAKYNFPALSGVKPVHKFAEVFGFPSAEPFIQKLKDVYDSHQEHAAPQGMFILVYASQSRETSICTSLHCRYEDALNEFREEVKNDICVLSTEEEIMDEFTFDTDDDVSYDNFIANADESTLRSIFQFLHEDDAIFLIKEQYVQKSGPAKTTAETSVINDSATSLPLNNYHLLLSDNEVNIEPDLSKPFDWYVSNDSGDYLDLEVEYTYAPETDSHDRLSLNLVVTFSYEENEAWFSFGDNKGDGFNGYISGKFSDTQSLADNLQLAVSKMQHHDANPNQDFMDTVNSHMDVFNNIIIAAKGLDTFIRKMP